MSAESSNLPSAANNQDRSYSVLAGGFREPAVWCSSHTKAWPRDVKGSLILRVPNPTPGATNHSVFGHSRPTHRDHMQQRLLRGLGKATGCLRFWPGYDKFSMVISR